MPYKFVTNIFVIPVEAVRMYLLYKVQKNIKYESDPTL